MMEEQANSRDENEIDDEVVDPDETIVIETDDENDNVGDLSVELNVEELVAKLEATGDDDLTRQRQIKRRLEQLNDEREEASSIDSTYNFNMDDDL